jgi:hypothetical protein
MSARLLVGGGTQHNFGAKRHTRDPEIGARQSVQRNLRISQYVMLDVLGESRVHFLKRLGHTRRVVATPVFFRFGPPECFVAAILRRPQTHRLRAWV